jgi:hypothetical protein
MEYASVYFSSQVCKRLNEKVNEQETLLDFIRDTEKEFKLSENSFYTMDIEELEKYIDFLDRLWNK